jgi:fatty acid desaturase
MSEPRSQSLAQAVQGGIVLAILVGGIGWLAVAAWRSGNPWWIGGMALFLGPLLLWFLFGGCMMAAHALARRRHRRTTGRDDFC